MPHFAFYLLPLPSSLLFSVFHLLIGPVHFSLCFSLSLCQFFCFVMHRVLVSDVSCVLRVPRFVQCFFWVLFILLHFSNVVPACVLYCVAFWDSFFFILGLNIWDLLHFRLQHAFCSVTLLPVCLTNCQERKCLYTFSSLNIKILF